MKRLILFLMACITCIVLICAPNAHGQIATVTDQTCTEVDEECTGPGYDGCNTTAFTVPETGLYDLKASIDQCGGGTACAHCVVDAYITNMGMPVACVHSGCCSAASTPVQLSARTLYTLHACKIPCIPTYDCDDCEGTCTARAAVSAAEEK